MAQGKIGRYVIESEIGRGGMATVYRAHDPRFEREVAVKVLPEAFLHDVQFRARFEREARTIAALEHPAIVPVYDFGEENGQPYLVMRYMAGGTLADRLRRGWLPVTEAARILNRLAPALDSAHRRGIIHRDLKPANILFDQWQEPYLSDFGIAKIVASSSTALTATGGLVGTPAYMSPEQVQGEEKLDGRSDIYAMGAILFEMLTGSPPYEADTPMGLAIKHVTEPVPRILEANQSLPPGYQEVITRAMAKGRDDRYQTANELAATVQSLAAGKAPPIRTSSDAPTLPEPPSEQFQAPPQAKIGRRPGTVKLLLGGLGLLVLIALCSVLGLYVGSGGEIFSGAPSATDNPATEVVGVQATATGINTPSLPTPEAVTEAPAPATTAAPSVTTAVPIQPTVTATSTAGPGRIVFQSDRDGDYEIFIMDFDGGRQTQLTNNDDADQFPAVSPDGRQIAFQSDRDGDWDIYVMNIDGRDVRRVTNDSNFNRLPNWSPDGQQLVFNSDPGGNFELFVVDVGGSNLRQITFNGQRAGHPSWSVNNEIVFNLGTGDAATWEIYVLNLDSGVQRRLTNNGLSDWSPEWSPDGRSILYLSEPGGDPTLYVMDADGGGQRPLYSSGNYDWGARWASDGRRILFTSDIGPTEYVYTVNADGSGSTEITAQGSYPSWAR